MSRERVKTAFVLLAVVLCAAAMSVVDGVLHPGYAVKSAWKLALFLAVPLGWFAAFPEERGLLRAFFRADRGVLRRAPALGAAVFAVILGGYYLLRGRIDFSTIAAQLTADAGVDAGNFLFVALYISFINTLLEEFFFRGFAFLTLRSRIPRLPAHLFGALTFAAYHLGMTAGWFSPAILALALLGLTAGGLLFNALDEKSGTLWASWLVHMCANFAINTIGMLMFRTA